MLYAFHTTNRWDQCATIICAADSEEEYHRWLDANPKRNKEEINLYVDCRPITFQEKIQDKRFRGFAGSIYEYVHLSKEQQDRFRNAFDVEIVTADRCREVHGMMLNPDKGDDYPWDDRRSIGEIIGEQAPPDEEEVANQVAPSDKALPIGVVDIRQSKGTVSINAIYRGKNANPDIPDEVLAADETTLRRQYAHIDLPFHRFELETLQELARETVTRGGWFYFPNLHLVIFQFQGDQHKYLQHFKRYQASQFAAQPTDVVDLGLHETYLGNGSQLPDAIRETIGAVTELTAHLYPETSLVGGCIVVPADEVLAVYNLAHIRQIEMGLTGTTGVAVLGLTNLDATPWAVIRIGNITRIVGLYRYGVVD